MYNTLKRQCAHLSPIISGDGVSTASTSSSTSSSPNMGYAPPPPSAVVSSSNSTNDLVNEGEPNWKIPESNWRIRMPLNKIDYKKDFRDDERDEDEMPSTKLRKISLIDNPQYARIEKKKSRVVRFRDDEENRTGSTTTLDTISTNYGANETGSSFWSDGGASYGFSKYTAPSKRTIPPPPPSPNSIKFIHPRQQSQPPNFPRTNPYATLPRHFTSHYSTKDLNFWPLSESGSSTTTTTYNSSNRTTTSSSESTTPQKDNVWTKYDRRFDQGSILSSSMANAQRKRILAGLKSFGIKGELLISILLNRGLITVTIDEGRNLSSPCVSGCCSTYVRLALMPDEEKRTQCKTELIPYSNRPVFHQTFTVELLPEDYEKRLVISMWHRETAKDKSILLGCMAFTIRHMVESNKVIDGWYFLLSPEYGRKKHLAVHKVNMLTYYGSVDESKNRNENEIRL